ncbi:MAG: hypothetical protein F6K40_23700 [Okeania sp. SIO3I5]|uniref:hypothetical protein n=1 Tax=Okeania sp. SIO3I5 TaxID=2607805 RepID=UPI0013BC40A2|nr:hypothetical protein [Okeania sp. SIO3I5]NEQ39098.1 hypothetical protein [Okeania sp. SIO3I5]
MRFLDIERSLQLKSQQSFCEAPKRSRQSNSHSAPQNVVWNQESGVVGANGRSPLLETEF